MEVDTRKTKDVATLNCFSEYLSSYVCNDRCHKNAYKILYSNPQNEVIKRPSVFLK